MGRNYRAHAAELGHEIPDKPLLFLKPPSAVIFDRDNIVLPSESKRVDYEGEVVVIIGETIFAATPAAAMAAVGGICCGNDVTARDIQGEEPQWTRAKGFDTFCPLGPAVVPASGLDLDRLDLVTRLNGVIVQQGNTRDLIFPVAELLSYISHTMTLEPGDAVFTGTPEGVGPLTPGDVVEVEIPGVGILRNGVSR